MRISIKIQILKNKWLGLLSIIILCFVQFSCKAQECNTLLINNIEVSKIKFLKIDCSDNKKVIESIRYTDNTIDSMKMSIIRHNGMIAESFLCNEVGVSIDIDNTYVDNLGILIDIASNMDLLGFTIFKEGKESYFYIPLIVSDNCH